MTTEAGYFNPALIAREHMIDPLAIGAVLFKDRTALRRSGTDRGVDLAFGRTGYVISFHQPCSCAAALDSFPDGGLYISADSGNISQQIVIDAGPLGAMRAGHGHADALSVSYSGDRTTFPG